ncbi:hypothetical protein ACL58G_20795 [Massilia sp. GER05]|uniref:hypothetical protein n=1 Tax=Massilia sp. GER05 TaxID=3394605 RepID=UPI003F8661FC
MARTGLDSIPAWASPCMGTLLLGASYRLDAHRTVNVSVGAGLTRDTPDLALTVRMPFGF